MLNVDITEFRANIRPYPCIHFSARSCTSSSPEGFRTTCWPFCSWAQCGRHPRIGPRKGVILAEAPSHLSGLSRGVEARYPPLPASDLKFATARTSSTRSGMSWSACSFAVAGSGSLRWPGGHSALNAVQEAPLHMSWRWRGPGCWFRNILQAHGVGDGMKLEHLLGHALQHSLMHRFGLMGFAMALFGLKEFAHAALRAHAPLWAHAHRRDHEVSASPPAQRPMHWPEQWAEGILKVIAILKNPCSRVAEVSFRDV